MILDTAKYLQTHIEMLGSDNVTLRATGIKETEKYHYRVTFTISDNDSGFSDPEMQGYVTIKASSKSTAVADFKKAVALAQKSL